MSIRGCQLKRFQYYLSNTLSLLIPNIFYRKLLNKKLLEIHSFDKEYIEDRVNYYNQLNNCSTNELPLQIKSFKKTSGTTYFFDLRNVIKYFPSKLRFSTELGDVTEVPKLPSFLKSRPISPNNQNSILLKLNAIRHYNFVDDQIPYENKKNKVVWRGAGFRRHRLEMLDKYYQHKQCDVGRTDIKNIKNNDIGGMKFYTDPLTIEEQLKYKFILSIEGKDVATNLKWIMSSGSLCMMSKPKFETWFMEGRLEAGVHYVELKDDYSDLITKIDYYLANENEAIQIIKNANLYVQQFKDKKRERLISLLVAKKYFEKTALNQE